MKQFGFALLLSIVSAIAQATVVVVPNELENQQGLGASCAPFGSCPGIQRYQQLYSSDQFSTLSGPMLISSVAFRTDTIFRGDVTGSLSDIRMKLSTTDRSSLSPLFADNIGSDETIVYAGPYAYNLQQLPGAFEIVFPLQSSFVYEPAEGNLVLELVNMVASESVSLSLDRVLLFGGVQQLVSPQFSGPFATNGQVANTGLVTQFTFAMPGASQTAPEPASLSLLLVGLLLTGCALKSAPLRSKIAERVVV